jgi:staphylococcal nuclease domain-containing protein 1
LLPVHSGNLETLPFSRIRPLDPKFKSLAGQASEARLSFVQPVPREQDLGLEAWDRFRSLTEVRARHHRFFEFHILTHTFVLSTQGRKLIANIDSREGNLLHLRLIDPADPNAAEDPLTCLNADLVREGKFGLA